MATTGHESEVINVGGLKANLQKLKTDIIDEKYEKPSGGIPDTDLSSGVQTSLGKADTALQSHQSKADLGLDNVTNDAQVKRTEMGMANGVATLDESGFVPSTQLPSYVDDVIDLLAISATAPEHCAKGDLYFNTTTSKVVRATGTDTWGTSAATNTDPEKGKIYVNLSDDKTYRWSGSTMVATPSSDFTGIKVGSSGSTLTPSQGVITIPEYEAGADVTDATNVKAALGTGTADGTFLAKDGTWQTPPNTEYVFNTPYNASSNKAATMADLDDVAYIEETSSTAVIADFDPQTDTVWKKAQILTTAEKDQVAANLNNRTNNSGMARIELKVVDNFKTVVEAQIGGNTIFVIKYNYELTGDVTIPANCVLEFDGGSITASGNNDTITGNKTKIVSNSTGIFSGILFGGTWNIDAINADWFADSSDAAKIQNAIIASRVLRAPIVLNGRDYIITESIISTQENDQLLEIKGTGGKTKLICNSNIPIFTGNISFSKILGVAFYGNNKGSGSYAFSLTGGYNTILERCYFYKFDIALKIGFVEFNINSCYFADNNYGVEIYKESGLNTCLNIVESTFINNAICAVKDNMYNTVSQTGSNVGACKKIKLDSCILEANGQAFELRYHQGFEVKSCWLERNTNASKIKNLGVVNFNNIFESEPSLEGFSYESTSFGYGVGGNIEINENYVKTRDLKFECYDDNYQLIDNGKHSLSEAIVSSKNLITDTKNGDAQISALMTLDVKEGHKNPYDAAYAYIKGGQSSFLYNTSDIFNSVSFNSTSKIYTINFARVINAACIVVTPNCPTQNVKYTIDKGNSTDYQYGVDYDTCNYLKLKFYDDNNDAVEANFSVLVFYQR